MKRKLVWFLLQAPDQSIEATRSSPVTFAMDDAGRRLFLKIERPVLQNPDVDQKAAKKSSNNGDTSE